MLDLPVRPALQELEVAPVRIEGQPTALAAGSRDLLMGVTDVLEVELPVFVGLIGQMLWLAGDGIDLATRGADLLDDALVHVAPQLGATRRSPETSVEEQDD